jgi:transcriptional regulator with XRE-family HTH domain
VDDREVGAILRSAREAAGLSLAALANRTFYSKGYLANVETGRRHATPDVIAAYERELGGDVDRRELLAGLVAGTVAPRATLAAVSTAFETALAEARLSVDNWLERVEHYGHDYMEIGAGEMQARLSADLIRIRHHLDDSRLCAAAARLLTVHGKTLPAADGREGAIPGIGSPYGPPTVPTTPTSASGPVAAPRSRSPTRAPRSLSPVSWPRRRWRSTTTRPSAASTPSSPSPTSRASKATRTAPW